MRAPSLLALLASLALVSASLAQGFPRVLELQGRLVDDQGAAIQGLHDLTAAFYTSSSTSTAFATATASVAFSDDGVFTMEVTTGPAVDPSQYTTRVYVGLEVDGGGELSPRIGLASAPYALRAAVAEDVEPQGPVQMNYQTIQNVGWPFAFNDASTKGYVDNEILDEVGNLSNLNTTAKNDTVAAINELETRLAALEALLQGVDRSGFDIRFTGVNVHVRSGTGATDGSVNGYGNLILGYNEASGGEARTGSHNLVVGKNLAYSSFGGVVAGVNNSSLSQYAAAIGGNGNDATGLRSVVIGGAGNLASGTEATTVGGGSNDAQFTRALAAGGVNNTPDSQYGTVVGGNGNSTTNQAKQAATVVGGTGNDASEANATVVGGTGNQATGSASLTLGGDTNNASGIQAVVIGGNGNTASQHESITVGGDSQSAGTFQAIELGGIDGDVATLQSDVGTLQSDVSDLQGDVGTLQSDVGALQTDVGDLETLTAPMELVGTEFRFTGVNVNIRDGSGQTVASPNGKGNLILGYNEASGNTRTGSHNLVIGRFHTYTHAAAIIAGNNNSSTADHASVLGGLLNSAESGYSVIVGGNTNTTENTGTVTAILGGAGNTTDTNNETNVGDSGLISRDAGTNLH